MITKMTKIVCGFPGVGKTYVCSKQKELGIFVADSDSSLFSRKFVDNSTTSIRNPDFPKNYIEYLVALINDHVLDYIFVSTHEDVRRALREANIIYTLVCPTKELKDDYIQRYIDSGSDENFVNHLRTKFDEFVESCENDIFAFEKVVLTSKENTLYDWIKMDIEDRKHLQDLVNKNKKEKTNS